MSMSDVKCPYCGSDEIITCVIDYRFYLCMGCASYFLDENLNSNDCIQ